ncbi:MAG: hypothetical protein JO235_24975 [Chroococcidiopsidaceae cyanobacterium CP_BM_RX_35]|nr:hypothetical protein [Chroococcidiopsidaceae cyanobacterium CP_BM_RX_35]
MPKHAPSYPHYKDKQAVIREAQTISDRLENYIRAWYQGKASATIPAELIPSGIDPDLKNFRLLYPDEVHSVDQWIIRKAEKINFKALHQLYPDPHATYLVLGIFFAPFNTKVIMSGEFPHSRFFDVQVSPPLDPAFYYYDGNFGVPEVPIVDVDIEPLTGHSNPFGQGANRNVEKRSYRLTWTLSLGNGAQIEPAYKPPYFRAPGNHRYASAIQYQGPLADPRSEFHKFGNRKGVWNTGSFWVRYYAPDFLSGPLGGVPLPKVLYELPTGERFFLTADFSKPEESINQTRKAWSTSGADPDSFKEAGTGWSHDFDIFETGLAGLFYSVGKTTQADKAYGRDLILGLTSHGMLQPPPGNYESSNSRCLYISYLNRGMSINHGKVAVLTGRLPKTPRTRSGALTMQGGQARYFSITSYPLPNLLDVSFVGPAITSVMDDEIITDSSGWYVIVYSRHKDRPSNAYPRNGVTWVDWGGIATQDWVLRWLSVHPNWRNPQLVPDVTNLPYETTSWFSPLYDNELIGINSHQGKLGTYQPKVHYLSKEEFEQLGSRVQASAVPDRKL